MDYKEKYEQALGRAKALYAKGAPDILHLEEIFPELKESEDEKIRQYVIKVVYEWWDRCNDPSPEFPTKEKMIAWLEKQGEQKNEEMPSLVCPKCMKSFEKCEDYSIYHGRIRYICPHCEYDGDSVEFETSYKNHPIHSVTPSMIQWKGNNLKQVIEFTGKAPKFNEWFKSFEEYETYVREHNNIFKLFNEDGSHYEVPVGAWIVKTPDGYNVPSKAKYKQKIEQNLTWSEEDEQMINDIIEAIDEQYAVSDYNEMVSWLKSIKERMKVE